MLAALGPGSSVFGTLPTGQILEIALAIGRLFGLYQSRHSRDHLRHLDVFEADRGQLRPQPARTDWLGVRREGHVLQLPQRCEFRSGAILIDHEVMDEVSARRCKAVERALYQR